MSEKLKDPIFKGKHEVIDPVSTQILEYWESINDYIMQRPRSPGWLAYFKTCQLKGTFRELDVAIAVQTYNGNKKLLMNGQTTIRAALETGWRGSAIARTYESPNEDHTLELFSTFDVINKRNTGHIVGGVAMGLGIESCYTILKAMPESILKIENEYTRNGCKTDGTFKPTTKQLFERAGVIEYYIDEIKIITDIFCRRDNENELRLKDGLSKNNFANNAVISSMLYTIQANREHGNIFWRDVILAENRNNVQAMECREYILTNSGTLNRANRVQLVSIVATLIRGWNRYMTNNTTRFKKVEAKHVASGTRFIKPTHKYIGQPLTEKI